jgi:hypothetical protein
MFTSSVLEFGAEVLYSHIYHIILSIYDNIYMHVLSIV